MVTLVRYCFLNLEYLTVKCRAYYLLHDLTSTVLTVVYIPLCVEVKHACDEIYTVTNNLGMEYSETLFIVASDFNQAKLKSVLPKYHQHVSRPSRGPNTLEHCYTTIKDTYCSIPCPQFGKSDHKAVIT
eukprot:g20888.t1